MKIETKFEIGDTFWVMDSNKPTVKKIAGVKIIHHSGKYYMIDYLTTNGKSYNQDSCFSSKEELIKSL